MGGEDPKTHRERCCPYCEVPTIPAGKKDLYNSPVVMNIIIESVTKCRAEQEAIHSAWLLERLLRFGPRGSVHNSEAVRACSKRQERELGSRENICPIHHGQRDIPEPRTPYGRDLTGRGREVSRDQAQKGFGCQPEECSLSVSWPNNV